MKHFNTKNNQMTRSAEAAESNPLQARGKRTRHAVNCNGEVFVSSSTSDNAKGETMKDSMTESTKNNDNESLPAAEDFTNENGELDAEAFKKSYQG